MSTQTARMTAQTLVSLGMRHVVICPGSRSAPLAYAFAELERAGLVSITVRIDERSGAFCALGLARGLRAAGRSQPVGVLTTSGSAVANVHPAVLEAAYSHVPLIALTADRPARLRGTGANQTLDDQSAVLSDTVAGADLAVGTDRDELIRTVEQLSRQAMGANGTELPGPVSLNVQFDMPLVPDSADVPWVMDSNRAGQSYLEPEAVAWDVPATLPGTSTVVGELGPRTVLLAGDDADLGAAATAEIAAWAQRMRIPILAEPSSSLRPHSILQPDRVLTAEPQLASQITDVVTYGRNTLFRSTAQLLSEPAVRRHTLPLWAGAEQLGAAVTDSSWRAGWEEAGRRRGGMPPESNLEAAVGTIASRPGRIFAASSNAVRYLAHVPVHPDVSIHAARGLAGVDGLISTAIGFSKGLGGGEPVRLIIGDVAALHDIGGLLRERGEPLPNVQIYVLNDNGGSIFWGLEQAQHHLRRDLERLFTTPHDMSFDHLATAYGWPYRHILRESDLVATTSATSPGLFEITGSHPGR